MIGAIAVVISLVYLSRQVKENTDALRTANAATVQANFQNLAGLFTEDREAGEIVLRGLELDDDLTRAERVAAFGWFFNCLKAGELAYHQFLSGQLDPEVWSATLVHFRAFWETPGIRSYWADRRHSFTPTFRAAMDEWLSESEAGPITRSDQFLSAYRPSAAT